MTLIECYAKMGADYEDTLRRLCSESLISRFTIKFLDDTNYEKLIAAVQEKDGEAAFAAAHTLKGIALNLGLTTLFDPVHALTEAVRHGWTDEATDLLPPVIQEYEAVTATIREWKESNE